MKQTSAVVDLTKIKERDDEEKARGVVDIGMGGGGWVGRGRGGGLGPALSDLCPLGRQGLLCAAPCRALTAPAGAGASGRRRQAAKAAWKVAPGKAPSNAQEPPGNQQAVQTTLHSCPIAVLRARRACGASRASTLSCHPG